jgi:hypothetical protein
MSGHEGTEVLMVEEGTSLKTLGIRETRSEFIQMHQFAGGVVSVYRVHLQDPASRWTPELQVSGQRWPLLYSSTRRSWKQNCSPPDRIPVTHVEHVV